MQLRNTLVVLVAALLVPVVSAGSSASPEITDAAGDTSNGALDIVKVWITNDASYVRFNFQVRDLSNPHPIDAGNGQYIYRLNFKIGANQYYVESRVSFIESQTAAGVAGFSAGAGTALGSSFGSRGFVSVAGDVLTINLERVQNGPFSNPLPAGTVLAQLGATTTYGAVPHLQNGFYDPRIAADSASAAVGVVYVVS